jgi:hypothetical protein
MSDQLKCSGPKYAGVTVSHMLLQRGKGSKIRSSRVAGMDGLAPDGPGKAFQRAVYIQIRIFLFVAEEIRR